MVGSIKASIWDDRSGRLGHADLGGSLSDTSRSQGTFLRGLAWVWFVLVVSVYTGRSCGFHRIHHSRRISIIIDHRTTDIHKTRSVSRSLASLSPRGVCVGVCARVCSTCDTRLHRSYRIARLCSSVRCSLTHRESLGSSLTRAPSIARCGRRAHSAQPTRRGWPPAAQRQNLPTRDMSACAGASPTPTAHCRCVNHRRVITPAYPRPRTHHVTTAPYHTAQLASTAGAGAAGAGAAPSAAPSSAGGGGGGGGGAR